MSQSTRDSGFTLIEVLVTVALMGALMAIAVSGWATWAKASSQSGTAREIESTMRQAQQQAVTEGQGMCVWFDDAADTYSVYRGQCSSTSKVRVAGPVEAAGGVHLDSPSFTSASGTSAGVSFQARGTGSPGDVRVTRDGASKVYVLSVDWLTGRVSLG